MPENADPRDVARETCARHDNRPDALIEILHDLQERLDCVPAETVPEIARALNLSRADVHGVVSFYHDFRAAPGGRHRLKLCRAEACQAVGSEALAAAAEHALGVRCGETSGDGAVSLETVYCLGNCALGPSAMLDGVLVGSLDEAALDALISQCRVG